ncbi:AEC family transporter [Acuticoccus sediminis]|uniref:AEC family transporter n=1 Tax=Acuticoccus sediminis TaxID=2184697 RepID=UPI001CFDD739|nr:AEC family transporter [Acuticoccus sediminis]
MIGTVSLALAPVFFTIGLGYFCGIRRLTDNQDVASLNTLTMTFALPIALFVAMATAPRTELLGEGVFFLVILGSYAAVFVVWLLVARLALGIATADASLQALTIAFPNLAGVALPIATQVLGPSGSVQVALAIAAGSITVSPLTLVLVELSAGATSPDGRGRRIRRALRHAVTAPVVLGPALGIAVSLCGFGLPTLVTNSLSLIGQAAAGLALFLSGLVLSAQPFRSDGRAIAGTLVADVARPLIALAVVLALAIPMETGRIAILMAAIPSGFFGILFAVRYGRETATIGSTVIASTLLSAITLGIVIAVLFPAS